jgi:hypothetical protein
MKTRRFLRVERCDHTKVEDYMRATFHGAEWLAGGCFGEVYTHPTDATKVIKITRSYDRAYVTYVKHIIHLRKHSPWFPVIHDAYFAMSVSRIREKYENVGEYYAGSKARRGAVWLVVVMERLESLYDRDGALKDVYYDLGHNAGEVKYSTRKSVGLSNLLANIGRAPNRLDKVAEALLNRLIKRYQFIIDMHEGNAMWKGDQVVLTDPFCGIG